MRLGREALSPCGPLLSSAHMFAFVTARIVAKGRGSVNGSEEGDETKMRIALIGFGTTGAKNCMRGGEAAPHTI